MGSALSREFKHMDGYRYDLSCMRASDEQEEPWQKNYGELGVLLRHLVKLPHENSEWAVDLPGYGKGTTTMSLTIPAQTLTLKRKFADIMKSILCP